MKREYVITITASYDDLVETETNLRRARKIAKDWLKDKDVKSVSRHFHFAGNPQLCRFRLCRL
ncbi:hypothetical protein C815_00949 [Firmicutes bacterium M10-2]|nr:hypothetical protein C815_00949 [Firmicutes bacterium M10-2]